MTTHITLATRLRQTRLARGLTQDELGKLTKTNQAVIQKIENGKSLQPRCIHALGDALNVNPAWLQFGEPYASKEMPK